MAQDNEDFLRRWARRKRDAAQPVRNEAKPQPAAPAPELPALDSLNFESDFEAFMQAKVEEGVKRAALKKLFSDPRFNVIDPLDIDIDDYSNLERIPEAAAKALAHARRTLFGAQDEAAEAPPALAAQDAAPAERPTEPSTETPTEPPAETQARHEQREKDDGATG